MLFNNFRLTMNRCLPFAAMLAVVRRRRRRTRVVSRWLFLVVGARATRSTTTTTIPARGSRRTMAWLLAGSRAAFIVGRTRMRSRSRPRVRTFALSQFGRRFIIVRWIGLAVDSSDKSTSSGRAGQCSRYKSAPCVVAAIVPIDCGDRGRSSLARTISLSRLQILFAQQLDC